MECRLIRCSRMDKDLVFKRIVRNLARCFEPYLTKEGYEVLVEDIEFDWKEFVNNVCDNWFFDDEIKCSRKKINEIIDKFRTAVAIAMLLNKEE